MKKKQIIIDKPAIEFHKKLKKCIKIIYAKELDLDVKITHVKVNKHTAALFNIELEVVYTTPTGEAVKKWTVIDINVDTMRIVGGTL